MDSDTSPPAQRRGRDIAPEREARTPWVAIGCYAAAAASLMVSTNTSWRFFDQVLHIPTAYGERYLMFAVAEVALVVCGAGMAVNVNRDGRPGSFRVVVWAMVIAMSYMAWAMSTPEEAVGRILLGPALGTVMLHLGLGLELRARHQRANTIARIGHELRERCLSRLGLADDGRDAAQRTRDRKAYKAAALSRPLRWPWSRQARLERALLAAGVADDPIMRDRMLARLAVVRHADTLSTLIPSSPWQRAEDGIRPGKEPAIDKDRATHDLPPRADGSRAPRTSSAQAASNDAGRAPFNKSTVLRGAQRQAVHATQPAPAPRAPRTLTAVPNSAAPHNGIDQVRTHARTQSSAHSDDAENAMRRAATRRIVDQAAIQQWLPVAETIVGDGLTKGRMRRWPEEEHPAVVATILADHAAGTRPSTIGRHHQVHHEIVGKILAAADELTG
ncbi:hypothetical protein ACRDU6_00870 (plasmid) [Mycolicibacterium sp. ELW1]|uniref:hypothetical protein n=1 Tax=Mycobacteriaceae TaxID=1762 RepID=UPI0011ED6855|nr:hypothetical protein [Mycobacterium sp. ELW1]QEN17522.1 hypothetical protein D3H54_29970 [Mycobacterium sp. ELW1]